MFGLFCLSSRDERLINLILFPTLIETHTIQGYYCPEWAEITARQTKMSRGNRCLPISTRVVEIPQRNLSVTATGFEPTPT